MPTISTRLDEIDHAVVFDVETTGLSPGEDRIVSIALLDVSLAQGEVFSVAPRLVNPGRSIPAKATSIHGISDADVAGAAPFEAPMCREIRMIVGDKPLIAHNASFDMRFLQAAFAAAGEEPLNNPAHCTMLAFREVVGQRKGSRLTDAVRYFGSQERSAHNALDDALMAFDVACALRHRQVGVRCRPWRKAKALLASVYRR